jgi:hypothetical protein
VPQSVSPYLSVVAASRNDDHGGDPLVRTQIFINNFVRQSERYSLPAELIIVDWNPVPDRPGLAAVMSIPSETACCRTRVITVPAVLHNRVKYADKLPFFQMIAKNVGIRRARGDFILATNIDIIFSADLMRFIARQTLNPKKLYRVDRYDIRNGLAVDCTLDESIEYAWANPIRANRRYQPKALIDHLYGAEVFKRDCIPEDAFHELSDGVEVMEEDGVWQIHPSRQVKMTHLHTNACGDFTLLSREGWHSIRGYPEFEAFSFNIDSMGLVAAHYSGYQEVSLLPPCVCFHIEHGLGSGWSPEGEKKLFARLREAGILNPEWPVLTPLVETMREQGRALEFNHTGWGMADFDLPEQSIGDPTTIQEEKLEQLALQARNRAVSAIQPSYDLDRLTLAHERRLADERRLAETNGVPLLPGLAFTTKEEKVVLYIPDANGRYSETRSISHLVNLINKTTVVFRLEQFARQFPLRFDPCQCSGLISIDTIVVFDSCHRKVVWAFDGRDWSKLGVRGTAILMNQLSSNGRWMPTLFRVDRERGRQPFRLVSTGSDPQVMLPPLPADVGFPLIVTIEMKLIPCD